MAIKWTQEEIWQVAHDTSNDEAVFIGAVKDNLDGSFQWVKENKKGISESLKEAMDTVLKA